MPCLFIETGSHYVAQAGPQLVILTYLGLLRVVIPSVCHQLSCFGVVPDYSALFSSQIYSCVLRQRLLDTLRALDSS